MVTSPCSTPVKTAVSSCRAGCRMGICRSCLIPLVAGKVRDLRTGEVHGDEGELIQTCVNAAAGPVHLDI